MKDDARGHPPSRPGADPEAVRRYNELRQEDPYRASRFRFPMDNDPGPDILTVYPEWAPAVCGIDCLVDRTYAAGCTASDWPATRLPTAARRPPALDEEARQERSRRQEAKDPRRTWLPP
jgi:hypothetical protein